MTSGPDRKEILELVDEAEQSGARHSRIAELLGLHARTLRRWREAEEEGRADRRPTAERPRPVNALSEEDREAVLELCNQPEYAHLPPSQIVPGWRTRASTWPRSRPSTASSERQAKPRTGDAPSHLKSWRAPPGPAGPQGPTRCGAGTSPTWRRPSAAPFTGSTWWKTSSAGRSSAGDP